MIVTNPWNGGELPPNGGDFPLHRENLSLDHLPVGNHEG